jgi:hypothetical protein
MQVLQVEGSFPFEDPLALTSLLQSLNWQSKIVELCVKGGAVQDCVKHKNSFGIITEKIIEDALAEKRAGGLRKFVFDLDDCENIEKERFMTLFALQPIKEYLTGCEDPKKEYKTFLIRMHGGHFFPYSFRGVSMERFCEFLQNQTSNHIVPKLESCADAASMHQKTKGQTAPPRRSNRLRGKPVENPGLK